MILRRIGCTCKLIFINFLLVHDFFFFFFFFGTQMGLIPLQDKPNHIERSEEFTPAGDDFCCKGTERLNM